MTFCIEWSLHPSLDMKNYRSWRAYHFSCSLYHALAHQRMKNKNACRVESAHNRPTNLNKPTNNLVNLALLEPFSHNWKSFHMANENEIFNCNNLINLLWPLHLDLDYETLKNACGVGSAHNMAIYPNKSTDNLIVFL